MPAELKPLQEFFNNRVFRIPDYQRGYAWGRGQLEDFWQDMIRLPAGRNHYTGQLTLEPVPRSCWERWDEDNWLIDGRSYKPYYIVDGQQRLTTSVILLKCLIDSVPDNASLAFRTKAELVSAFLFCTNGVSRAYIFGYEKDNPSYDYFKTQILGQVDNGDQGIHTVYTANLLNAKAFFQEQLKGKGYGEIEEIFKRVTQRFVFNEYELDRDLDVFVAFETMNNRGKSLSKLELLKNRLIYLSTLVRVDEDQQLSLRRNITNAWKTIYEYLGKEVDRPLDDDEFLRAHWIISFNYARDEADQFAVFLLDKHFTPDRAASGDLKAHEIQQYVDNIQNAVQAWHAIHFPHRQGSLREDVVVGIDRLQRIGVGAFAPLMMASLLRGVSAATVDLLMQAERFVFVVRRLCNRKSNTGDVDFYKMAGQLNRGGIDASQAVAAVKQMADRFFSLEKMVTEFRELFENGGEGYYWWSGRQFFLFEYEQHLRKKAGMHGAKINWSDFTNLKRDHVTTEHIYPQTPDPIDWPQFEQLNNKERSVVLNSLGNLLALSQSRNSKFSNHSFALKKQDRDGVRGYYNGSYSEIEVAQYDEWSPKRVFERGIAMLDFLEEKWDVNLGGLGQKTLLLGLEFLVPEGERPKTINDRIEELTRELLS